MTDRFEDVVRGEFAALPTPPPLDPARVVAHARTQGRGLRLALWVAIAVLAALLAGTVWVWSSVEHASLPPSPLAPPSPPVTATWPTPVPSSPPTATPRQPLPPLPSATVVPSGVAPPVGVGSTTPDGRTATPPPPG